MTKSSKILNSCIRFQNPKNLNYGIRKQTKLYLFINEGLLLNGPPDWGNLKGFINKKIEYKNYSILGKDYLPLKNLLIKADALKFCCIKKDTTENQSIHWSVYNIEVGLKLIDKWNIVGISDRKPIKEKVNFEIWVSEKNTIEVYDIFLKGHIDNSKKIAKQYLKNSTEMGFFDVKNLVFPFYSNENNFLIFSPNVIFKLRVAKIDVNTNLWLTNYLTYDLSRGIKLKVNNDFYELDSDNLIVK